MKILEIILAMVILAITMMVIYSMTRNTYMMSQDTKAKDTAYLVAEKKFTDLSLEIFPSSIGVDTMVINDASYITSWSIMDTANIQRAVITVSWRSIKGIRSINFSRGL